MSPQPRFGKWMVAVAEAAEVAGAPDLDGASVEQMVRAWELVQETAGLSTGELKQSIAAEAGVPVARLDEADRRAEILLPGEVAHRRNVLPMTCDQREVVVATANPLSQDAKREINRLTGRTVRFRIASPSELAQAVEEAYGSSDGQEEPIEPDERVSPTGPHVLVVDDEAGQRELIRSVLESDGYQVTTVKDGPAAVKLLKSSREAFALVTLDYWMDKMNGLRVLQQIRADHDIKDVPVIMLTGAGDRRIEMSLFEAGADDFIAKPLDPPLFLLRIQAVLRRRRFP